MVVALQFNGGWGVIEWWLQAENGVLFGIMNGDCIIPRRGLVCIRNALIHSELWFKSKVHHNSCISDRLYVW